MSNDTVTVFRVEHRRRPAVQYDQTTYENKSLGRKARVNLGFFYCDNPIKEYYSPEYSTWRKPYSMPVPGDDGLNVDSSIEFFCFASIEDLKKAFPDDTRALFDRGDIVVREYRVERVRHGMSQSLFDYRTVQYRRIIKV